ncbi:unnamed protein product [Diplocarpon coronariae]
MAAAARAHTTGSLTGGWLCGACRLSRLRIDNERVPLLDFATLQLCDFATLRLCDLATLRPCDFATLRPGSLETWRRGDSEQDFGTLPRGAPQPEVGWERAERAENHVNTEDAHDLGEGEGEAVQETVGSRLLYGLVGIGNGVGVGIRIGIGIGIGIGIPHAQSVVLAGPFCCGSIMFVSHEAGVALAIKYVGYSRMQRVMRTGSLRGLGNSSSETAWRRLPARRITTWTVRDYHRPSHPWAVTQSRRRSVYESRGLDRNGFSDRLSPHYARRDITLPAAAVTYHRLFWGQRNSIARHAHVSRARSLNHQLQYPPDLGRGKNRMTPWYPPWYMDSFLMQIPLRNAILGYPDPQSACRNLNSD